MSCNIYGIKDTISRSVEKLVLLLLLHMLSRMLADLYNLEKIFQKTKLA